MIKKIEKYLNKNYEFRYDVIKTKSSYKKRNSDDKFSEVNDFFINSLKRELDKKGLNITKANLYNLLNSNFVKTFNPFEEYFNSLPAYDNKKDYINELAETVKTTDDVFFKWAFKKWLVAMVACALEENATNQQILILSGKQGCGKTTWLNKMIPEEFYKYVYKGVINPDNKDTKIAMSEYIIMNMDELSGYSKRQIEAFKEMITLDKITERKPYGLCTEDHNRVCSFVGSTNDNEILIDITGNRRFLCTETIEINFNHKIDLNLVYSQAYDLYKSQFKYYFDEKDTERIEKNNIKYIKDSVESEWICKLFRVPKDDEFNNAISMTATEVGEYIKKEGARFAIEVTQIGKTLKAKGFKNKKSGGISKYKLIIK